MGSLSASSVSYFFETLANGQSRTFCLKQQKPCWCVSDVNECGTQLVLCDANADCLNWFGSYSCRCRSGFQDVSRVGSGGTVCVDATEAAGATAAVCQRGVPQINSHPSHFFFLVAGCSSGLSAETKGVYVLFFLLSALIVTLLVAAGMLYRRHHRGAFLVHCQKTGSISSHEPKKEGSFCPNAELPPPPPPSRGYREAWPPLKEGHPPVDLPLLRFNPLLPPEDAK